jgi:regulator of protease activity HflC (stomatin/prohibitin superfamily)
MPFIIPVFVLVVFFLATSLRVLKQYERGVVYTFGRVTSIKEPGLRLLIPIVQLMTRVDTRVKTINIPSQDIISRDNIAVKVNAVVYFSVIDANKAINHVENFMLAASEIAQTTLRAVLGKHELDDMLSERDKLSADILAILEEKTTNWGLHVSNVELKNIDIDPSMIHAIGRQAEAERERRAKIISAEGELQAADKLVEAARKLSTEPTAMQLRYLSAFQDVANDKTNTIILPLPMEILKRLL